MDGMSIFITLIFLLILTLIGLIRAQSMLGVTACFFLLTLTSYITIYMFKT